MQQIDHSEGFTTQHSQSRSGGSTLDNIKTTVADKLNNAADALRQKSGQGGAAGYAGQASDWLTNAADYVRDVDPTQLKSTIQEQVRSNPARSLLIAAGAGLALGILLRR
jgi:ElaB/YqjD/DUF883 family membrane-anchored ribosome-binding protein